MHTKTAQAIAQAARVGNIERLFCIIVFICPFSMLYNRRDFVSPTLYQGVSHE